MANFRAIPTKMWADDTFLSMSPEQKLIFIYLHTSPYVTQCGIYRLQIKTMGFHLGYTSSPIESALTGFCAAFSDFVAWDKETGEIALLQYPNLFLKDAPQKIWNYVVKELAEVQSMVLLKKIIEKSSATTAKPYLSRLRAINMEIQNQKRSDVNTLLDIDLMQDTENQNVTSEIEIEIESEKEIESENIYTPAQNQKIEIPVKNETEKAPPDSALPPPAVYVEWNSPGAYLWAAKQAKEYLEKEKDLLETICKITISSEDDVFSMIDTFFAKHCDSSHILRNWQKQFGQIQHWLTIQKRNNGQTAHKQRNTGVVQNESQTDSRFERLLKRVQ